MEKLINYNSEEGKILKPIFQNMMIDSFITRVIESFMYKEIITYWSNGIVNEKYLTKFGEIHGKYQKWHPNGQLCIETNYVEGVQKGLKRIWYETGQKRFEGYIENNQYVGDYKIWYKNGQLREEKEVKDGEIYGIQKYWFSDGKLAYKKICKEGQSSDVDNYLINC